MGKLIRAISGNGMAVCYALDSTDMVGELERIHRSSAVVTAATGRLLTAASIMGSMLKGGVIPSPWGSAAAVPPVR